MKQISPYEEFLKRLQKLKKDSSRRRESEETLKLIDWFAHAVLNSLSAHIAILDEDGVIIQTNQAWREFAMENDLRIRPSSIGVNYLDLCDGVQGKSAKGARAAAEGIRNVIAGKEKEFIIDYPMQYKNHQHWYYMRVTRLPGSSPIRVVVSHEDITDLKLAEEALRKRELQLEVQQKYLEETNTTLRVLLKKREEDKRMAEESVLSNIKDLVIVYLEKLKRTKLEPLQRQYVEIIESHLSEIISPFLHNLRSRYIHLTPREIEVAGLIKDGKTTKEIAEILKGSPNVINFHRKNIRKKLGLTNKKANLQSFLYSMTK